MPDNSPEQSPITPQVDIRKQILTDSNYDQLVKNAQKYLEKSNQPPPPILPTPLPEEPSILQKSMGRRGFLGLLGLGAAALGAAVINNKLPLNSFGQESPTPTATSTATPIPTEVPKPPEKPVKLFDEVIQPFVDEAFKKRAERAKKDPEYLKRIDPEINRNRINFVLFGYWEEHGEVYEDYGGSISVMSLDLTTKKIAVSQFSRDIRCPELEKKYPTPERKWRTVREAYKLGKFDTLREVSEDMTGLSADFQIVLRDTVIKDMVDKFADGKLDINVLQELHTQPYPFNRKQFGTGYIPAGPQQMNSDRVMQYILAEDQNPDGKIFERSYRKNIAQEALIKKIKEKLKSMSGLDKLNYIRTMFETIETESNHGNLEVDFNLDLIRNVPKAMLNLAKSAVQNFGKGIDTDIPDIGVDKQHIFHDKYFGDGGVTRVHNILNYPDEPDRPDSLAIKQDVEEGALPNYMLIPDSGDPTAKDLPNHYWQSTRKLVKQQLLAV